MKREKIEAGAEYVTVDHSVVRIYDNEPGYSMAGGKWVSDPQTDRRYMGPLKGWQEYKANIKIRATEIGCIDQTATITPVKDRKVCLAPREIMDTVEDYTRKFRESQKVQAKVNRTTTQIKRALTQKGFKVVSIDADKGQVVLDLQSVTEVLVNG